MNLPEFPFIRMRHVLFVGVGGGYDIVGAVPIAHTIDRIQAIYSWPHHNVFAHASHEIVPYFEDRLHQFEILGAVQLVNDLSVVIESEHIDTIIAVDGGVDCLMHGDEESAGTVLQDFVMLAALGEIQKKFKDLNIVVSCVGLTCEAEEHIDNYAVMQNISMLMADRGFYGTCSLVKDTPEYNEYSKALAGCKRKSHIQVRVLAAANGIFGDVDLGTDANLVMLTPEETAYTACINPLMSIYWFFNYNAVAARNPLLPMLAQSKSKGDALRIYRGNVKRTRPRRDFVL